MTCRARVLPVVLLVVLAGVCQAQIDPEGNPGYADSSDWSPLPSGAAAAQIDPQAPPVLMKTIGLDHRHQYSAESNIATGSNFASFRAAISTQGYLYTSRDTFEASDLTGLKALVLYQPYTSNTNAEFTTEEITAIHNFVATGGGLFVISDVAGGSTITSLNQVVAPYGIVYDTNTYDGNGRTFSHFWYHPVTVGVSKAKVDYQRGMTISAPSHDMTVEIPALLIAVAADGNDFLALRESEAGIGNCAFVTDSSLFSDTTSGDANIDSEDNLDLLKNILDFIVKNQPYTCDAPPSASYFRSIFESSTECWAFGTAAPAFVAAVGGRSNGALYLTPTGSAAAFGFWTSPPLTVTPFKEYTILWTVRSTGAAAQCPQFRLRVNDLGGRDSVFRAVESRGGAENSPGTTDTIYETVYVVPPGVTQVTLSFDLLSFDPADNLATHVELREVSITPY